MEDLLGEVEDDLAAGKEVITDDAVGTNHGDGGLHELGRGSALDGQLDVGEADGEIVDGHLVAAHDGVEVVALTHAGLPLNVLRVDVGELGTGVDDEAEFLVCHPGLDGDAHHLVPHGQRHRSVKGLVAVAEGELALLAVDNHAVIAHGVEAKDSVDLAPEEVVDVLDVDAHDGGTARMVLAHDGERGNAAEGDGAAGIDEHRVAVAVDDKVAVKDLEGECLFHSSLFFNCLVVKLFVEGCRGMVARLVAPLGMRGEASGCVN